MRLLFFIPAIIILLLNSQLSQSDSVVGNFYRDANWDGIKGQNEYFDKTPIRVLFNAPSVGSIVVNVDLNGQFLVSGLITGEKFSLRVDPSSLPSYLHQGYASQTSSFLNFGTVPSNITIGYVNERDYCKDNISDIYVATNCYVYGDQSISNMDVLVDFPLTGGVESQNPLLTYQRSTLPQPTHIANAQQIGSTWGLTYQRKYKQLFAASFMKRHSGFPNNVNTATGVIYRINLDPSGTIGTSSVAIDLEPTVQTGASFNNAHNLTDYNQDAIAWDHVGKYALGGLTIDDDGESLYVVSLNSKTIVRIAVSDPSTPLTIVSNTPIPYPTDCPAGDVRPFAITYKDGLLYVGMVCSAESTQSRSNLRAYVYSMDPNNMSSNQQVLNFPLDFSRGESALAGLSEVCVPGLIPPPVPTDYNLAIWNPWVTIRSEYQITTGQCHYPQPILSDIAFGDTPNQLTLGFMDRYGHQSGSVPPPPANINVGDVSGVAIGDVLCASKENGSWILENNANCGMKNGGYSYKMTFDPRPGVGNNEGPGSGEFFSDDSFPPGQNSECSLGGLTSVPGTGVVLSSTFDAFPFGTASFRTGGVRSYDLNQGKATRYYTVYQQDANGVTFGKAAGLGDLEALCDLPPLQIGNRIWFDENSNGLQDLGEQGIPNVRVSIYLGSTLIATTQSNSEGEWYFSSRDGLKPNSVYNVVFNNSDLMAAMTNPTLSPSYIGGDNQLDSNGYLNGNDFALVVFTGMEGSVDHSFDIGIYSVVQIGGVVFYDANVDGLFNTGDNLIASVNVTLYDPSSSSISSTILTDSNGLYTFTVKPNSIYYVFIQLDSSNPSLNGTVPTYVVADMLGSYGSEYTLQGIKVSLAQVNINQQNNLTVNFGFKSLLFIGDYVFYDRNADGIQDALDEGVFPVNIALLDSSYNQITTTSTDSNGFYRFQVNDRTNYFVAIFLDQISLSNYQPTLTTGPDATRKSKGTLQTIGSQIASVASVSISITNDTTIDFGFRTTLSLGGRVFYDFNSNGIIDITDNFYGSILLLLQANGAVVANTTTQATGTYSFNNIMPNTQYTIIIPLFGGNEKIIGDAAATYLNVGPDGIDSKGTTILLTEGSTLYATYAIVDIQNTINTTVNFGYRPFVTLGDFVWYDSNANGIQDANETGIAGIQLVLSTQDNFTFETTTNASGYYYFIDIYQPVYPFTISIPLDSNNLAILETRIPTTPLVGTNTSTNSKGVLSGNSVIASSSGLNQSNFNFDFGFRPNISISGVVWYDTDANGQREPQDSLINGVTVSLFLNGVTLQQTQTNMQGLYSFNNLQIVNEEYTVVVVLNGSNAMALSGLIPTNPFIGPDQTDSNGVQNGQSVQSIVYIGQVSNNTVDFGFKSLLFIGDFVWYDENGNQVQDSSEPGIPGITVQILDTNQMILDQTVTNGTGYYHFVVQERSNYIVRVPLSGGNAAILNNRVPTGSTGVVNGDNLEMMVNINLLSNLDVDFGFKYIISIGDYVWFDENKNGIQDSSESGISNVTITLISYRSMAQTVTNANGLYSFQGILPNTTYIVYIELNDSALQGKVPSSANRGGLDSKGRTSLLNGTLSAIYELMVMTQNRSDVDFGFIVPIPSCDLEGSLYSCNLKEDSHIPSQNDDWNKHSNSLKKPKHESCSGIPLTVSVRQLATSACLTIEASDGIIVDQIQYLALSGHKSMMDSSILSATSNGVDITNRVRMQTYRSGSRVCSNSSQLCLDFAPMSDSKHPLIDGDTVFCLACSPNDKNSPIEICFDNSQPFDLSVATFKVKATGVHGWCSDEINAYGLVSPKCTHTSTCLNGEIVCDAQCDGQLPLKVVAWAPEEDIVCLEISSAPGVSIGSIPYFTFVGRHIPISDPATTIVRAMDGSGNVVNYQVPIERYTGGNICSNYTGCEGFKVNQGLHVDIHEGDVSVCMSCSQIKYIPAPLEVCFSRQGLMLADFENAIIKLKPNNICGFCGEKEFVVAAVLKESNVCDLLLMTTEEENEALARRVYFPIKAGPCPCDEDEVPDKHDDHKWNDDEDNKWNDDNNKWDNDEEEDCDEEEDDGKKWNDWSDDDVHNDNDEEEEDCDEEEDDGKKWNDWSDDDAHNEKKDNSKSAWEDDDDSNHKQKEDNDRFHSKPKYEQRKKKERRHKKNNDDDRRIIKKVVKTYETIIEED